MKLAKKQWMIVKAARDLMVDRQRCIQDAFAVSRDGVAVDVGSPETCRFCAVGSLYRAATDLGYPHRGKEAWLHVGDKIASLLVPEIEGSSLQFVNNGKGGHRRCSRSSTKPSWH